MADGENLVYKTNGNTYVADAQDIDIIITIYSLLAHSDTYSKTS